MLQIVQNSVGLQQFLWFP